MEMDPKYFPLIAAIIALGGIGLGSLFAEFREWFQIRRGNRKLLSSVLYHELELLGQLSLIQKSFTDELIENFNKHLNLLTAAPPESRFPDTDEMSRMFWNVTKAAKEPEIEAIIEKHDAVLLDLASADPLLALELRPEYHFPFPHRLETLFNQFDQMPIEDPKGMEFVKSIAPWIAEEIEPKLQSSLTRSVKKVAWKISFRTWVRVHKKLGNSKNERSKQIDEYNKKYVQHIVKFVMRNLKEID